MSKVHLNLSRLFQLFLLFQLFHSLRWNILTISSSTYSQKLSHLIYYSSIPPLPISKIVKRNAVDLSLIFLVIQTKVKSCKNNLLGGVKVCSHDPFLRIRFCWFRKSDGMKTLKMTFRHTDQ